MAESIVAAARDRISLSEIGGAVAIAVVFYSLGYEEMAIVPLLGVVLGPIATRAFDALDLGLTSLRILFGPSSPSPEHRPSPTAAKASGSAPPSW